MTEETTILESTLFPPGYGDFALQSSDGLICHISRHILAYMSETFRDMFSLPAPEGKEEQSTESHTPLELTESGQILELFLTHIDPKRQNLRIDPSAIISLLEMARKYQVPTITEWFESEATLKHEGMNNSQVFASEPFIEAHPILALYCAANFNLSTIGQFALQVFASCHESRTQPTVQFLDIPSYLEGAKLRESRRKLFATIISQLADLRQGGLSASYSGTTCSICTRSLCGWILTIERAVTYEPSWRAFMGAYGQCPEPRCGCRKLKWSGQFKKELVEWERKVKTAESSMPAWPF